MKLTIYATVGLDYDNIYPGYYEDLKAGLYEDLPTGDLNDQPYDDLILEDWYTFAAEIEYLIDSLCDTVNISLSKSPYSLSEYIDFYAVDENGNKQNHVINLRLSDHKSTASAKEVRRKNVINVNPRYKLIGVTVNNKTFKSYYEAFKYVKQLILSEMFHK